MSRIVDRIANAARVDRPADWAKKRARDGVNHWLRDALGGRLAGLCQPTWISVLMTERCNARCLHCDIWKNRGREHGALDLDQWRDLFDQLRDWLGPAHVCVTGGEALLREQTIDLVAHGSEIGLFVELLTHGYWKDQARIRAVARARPWRITMSVDGVGEVHDTVRGRKGFYEATQRSLATFERLRRQEGLPYSIRLKTVIMRHNVASLAAVARLATEFGADVLYQPIEQNYNTEEDLEWYLHSDNWPTDTAAVCDAVERLRDLKRRGLAIANTDAHLDSMSAYFRDPIAWQRLTRQHSQHESRPICSALGLLQIQPNGDVQVCHDRPPVGNVGRTRIREIWSERPRWWVSGCCQG